MRRVALALILSVSASCWPRPPGVRSAAVLAAGTTEVGELGGAPYRIDIPPGWNGGLVVFFHGYRGGPVRFDARAPDEMAQTYAPLGYAVAQSGYSAGGYAVREAVGDAAALRAHFTTRFGQPKETWISGHSMGGSITMTLMETQPTTYDGGLSLCAPLGPMIGYTKTLAFDPLVLFEYLFPGHLPSPAHVPADFMTTLERTAKLEKALDANAKASAALRRFTNAETNKALAMNLDLFTYILGELARRVGGNAFDNRDTIYTGTGDDGAINAGVKRYRADERARALAISIYTPTGRLVRPLLSVLDVSDPLVGLYPSDRYPEIAQIAGSGELFAQQYVRESGHCAFTPQQVRSAFEELRRWRRTGERPPPGAVP
ncbi:MAG TPA: alpha/beta hydrolase [Polyangia bacterium]|nr:alpha/beta hydrolase [Polyangia bacterium]